ncbi:MAG: HAMP domain-containing protein [Chitinivibrionales bacterium]|nr:HAMP domain-containing protein [Chitinivibrionales bacterium]
MRINIAPKVFLGFLAIVLLNVFYVAIVYRLSDLNSIAHILKMQDNAQQDFLRISNLHGSRKRSLVIYNSLENQQSIDKFRSISSTITNVLDSLEGSLKTVQKMDSAVSDEGVPNEKIKNLRNVVSEGIQKQNRQYINGFEELTILYEQPNSIRNNRKKVMLGKIINQADSSFTHYLDTINTVIDAQTNNRINDIESRLTNAQQLTFILLVGISAIAVLFALIFSRAITNSLRKLKESASLIGKGNFYFNPSGYPKDEIGDLASAFFDMALDLKKAQEELVKFQRLAAIGEVVASVNHEINNPLMIISGNAQFLEMSMRDVAPELRDRVRTILEETERISQVTRKLREIKNPVVEDYTSSGEQMINLDKSSRES